MKIQQITTQDGIQIEPGNLVVLVGPNNVGKSQFLKDIHNRMINDRNTREVIIKQIEFERPSTFDELIYGLRKKSITGKDSVWILDGINSRLNGGDSISLSKNVEENYQEHPLPPLIEQVGKLRVAYLEPGSRLQIATLKASSNPDAAPNNLLQSLLVDRTNIESELQDIFKLTFGKEIMLDHSRMVELQFRVADEFDKKPEKIQDIIHFFSQYETLDQQGDGFKSFVGVVLSLLLSKRRIILLDEPEAFLHPTQARTLGRWVSQFSERADEQIFVATHNANFLSGLLSGSDQVDIFRLNRFGNDTQVHEITSDAISKITKSPILSSQPVHEAIFYEGVIVCEADTDRIFYQKVFSKEFEAQDTLF